LRSCSRVPDEGKHETGAIIETACDAREQFPKVFIRTPLPLVATSGVRKQAYLHGLGIMLRSSKAVYISAWLDRRAGREEIVPKLLHARAPQNIEEERKIRKLAGSRHAPGDWIFRARIISLSWQGLRTAKIAEKLGCHPKTVRKRLHRFNAEGIDGLGDRPGAGRKPRITEDERSRIIALVSKDPPGKLLTEPGGGLQPEDETKAAYWTLDALAEAANEIGIEVGRSQVRRILLAEGVRWRRTRPWAESADPEFVPKDRG
jgi:transposase